MAVSLKGDTGSGSELDEPEAPGSSGVGPNEINAGDWVAVQYEGDIYSGRIEKIESNSIVRVKCLTRTNKYFRWPAQDDIMVYNVKTDIKMKIKEPKPMRRGFFDVPELNMHSI